MYKVSVNVNNDYLSREIVAKQKTKVVWRSFLTEDFISALQLHQGQAKHTILIEKKNFISQDDIIEVLSWIFHMQSTSKEYQ